MAKKYELEEEGKGLYPPAVFSTSIIQKVIDDKCFSDGLLATHKLAVGGFPGFTSKTNTNLVAMPRGISLTEFQKGQAIAYRNDGKTIREIAGILKIGNSAIAEFLKNPDAHGKRGGTGRPRKLTPKEQRNLLRQLKKEVLASLPRSVNLDLPI
ncbi:hypothetical protein AVEN_205546-1 [Araneus ventricosus]|uniref:Tc3 transposase DNA binding domain-containing protein n=1 Tax=Araneus ventricosus TaxID=182803 RepID=A0A4Y2JNE1_ARAVE|nr:hypothetical protein AVEN_205546-1 [Araneus ventricosus]